MTKITIIGIAGHPASGKSTIARYLADAHGYYHFEGSDYLRQAAKDRGTILRTRMDYSNLHRLLQQEQGETVIADYLLGLGKDKVVFAGLRSAQNALALQRAGGIIIGLEAPPEVRFKRAQQGGLKSQVSLEEFRVVEGEQLHSDDHLGADLASVLAIADVTLDTSLPISSTLHCIDELLQSTG